MRFIPIPLSGAYVIEPEPREDDRGSFFRAFCQDEFKAQGLPFQTVQCNMSENRKKGTLRGMHFQKDPFAEIKIVRCVAGAIYDVIIDLRPESPTYLRWHGVELSAQNKLAFYVPEHFAHGYLTLSDNSTVFYQVSEFYHPEADSGIPFDEARVNIVWPITPTIISDKDRKWKPV
ncbi:dTDP-4-dehydrorhamnose 3,5-epimerase [Synergistales bacterium]|nr:dTDP-4-dehydrorhamnose 3,5-epimerase [Synergistales bacterium]